MSRIFILLLCCTLTASLVFGQTNRESFGKNRVQYHRDFDEWLQYESDNFITYWYGEARNIGQTVVQLAEYDFDQLQNVLEHRINEKVQIIVYTDITDLKQSNIGNEEVFETTSGQAKFLGNKVFVYFNGDHTDLRRQIREGIASVYLEHMLFGSNLQEVVQNAVLMNLPDWFKAGLLAYIGRSWSVESDTRLRQLLLSGEYETFEELSEEFPRLAGHAFWYYIAQNFGEATVSNLLYLTRINRSVESGFLYVLGSPYEVVLFNWRDFFLQRYREDLLGRQAPTGQEIEVKNRKQLPVTQVKLSPDGQRVVYVTNDIGKYRVYLQEVATGERKIIHKGGFRNALQATDYNYPLLAWNPSGYEIAILYEQRDQPKLMRYDLQTGKDVTEDLSTEYHRVYSMDYVNPSTLVYSATVRGFSDIFLYYPQTRQSQRITNDFYDDLDARAVRIRGRSGIVFASNRIDSLVKPQRLDTILPIKTFDLFYYDIENKPGEFVRITHTPLANERNPIAIDSTWFGYLTDQSGIYNRAVGYLEDYIHHYEQRIYLQGGDEIVLHADSSLEMLDTTLIDSIEVYPIVKERAVTHNATNVNSSMLSQHTAPRVKQVLEVYRDAERFYLYKKRIDVDTFQNPPPTAYQISRGIAYELIEEISEADTLSAVEQQGEDQQVPPTLEIDIDNYLFQSQFDDQAPPPAIIKNTDEITEIPTQQAPLNRNVPREQISDPEDRTVYKFRPGRIVPYRLQFRLDYITFTADNNYLFQGLDSYSAAGSDNAFNALPIGLLLKGSVKDLFEDYVIDGGIRIPTTFDGTEYFLIYHDRKRRLDKYYALYRRNTRLDDERLARGGRIENNTLLGQFGVRYPLDIFRSLRATFTLRRDRVQPLVTDRRTLETDPLQNDQRIGLRLEYVFDNTLQKDLNILNGTRYKIFAEVFKTFSINTDDGFQADFGGGYLGYLGFDARHYLPLDKRSILAFRAAGGTTFGTQRILFILGGTDNWIFPEQNTSIPQPTDPAFAFRKLENGIRGFDINIRNGSTFLLGNSELRVPIFQYFSRRIRSPFFRNFQVVGFFDIGTAWVGSDPFSEENPLNTTTYPQTPQNNPVVVRVTRFRDPVVIGYGGGLRTTLFGYFVRLDYAWGIETRRVQDPKIHLSLGLDF